MLKASAAVRAYLLAQNVVEVAIALRALQQVAARTPKSVITHALGQNALAFVVAAAGTGVLARDLQHPPAQLSEAEKS